MAILPLDLSTSFGLPAVSASIAILQQAATTSFRATSSSADDIALGGPATDLESTVDRELVTRGCSQVSRWFNILSLLDLFLTLLVRYQVCCRY